MAINLWNTADSSLVSVAYRAGMANVPADHSRALEQAANSYSKMMDKQGEMWSNIATVGIAIGAAVFKDIKTVPPEGTDIIQSDLDETQDFMKMSYGLIPAKGVDGVEDGTRLWPGGKDAKKLRAETRQERQRLFAEAEYELEGLKNIQNRFNTNTVDPTVTGIKNMELAHAAIATSRDKTTEYGNYFKWENIDGARKWVLYNDPAKNTSENTIEGMPSALTNQIQVDADGRVLDRNGKMIATTTAEIAQGLQFDSLHPKTGQPIMKTQAKATAAQIQDMGFKSNVPFEELDDYTMYQIQEIIDAKKNNPVAWHTASYSDPGNRSFYNRITNADKKGPSEISTDIYVQIGQLTGYDFVEGKGIKMETSEGKNNALTGLKDSNNDGHISQKELAQEENIKLFSHALFGGSNHDPTLTAALYEADQMQNYGNVFNDGFKKRSDQTLGIKMKDGVRYKTGQGDRTELGSDIKRRFGMFMKNQPFKSYDGTFTFGKKDEQWNITGPQVDNTGKPIDNSKTTTRPMSEFNVSEMMGFNNQSHMLGGWNHQDLSRIGSDSDDIVLLGEEDEEPGYFTNIYNAIVGN